MADDSGTLETVDTQQLFALLPHRYPFLMIDRIVDIDGDRSAVGIKSVTVNEPHFAGHFPGRPIMPGVLLIEGMAQTAGAICAKSIGVEGQRAVYFMSIERARFRRLVLPGETVEYHVRKLHNRRRVWKYECVAKVGETRVAEAIISAMMTDE
jgi:3-hydroxyacyl-[acyl-carrier-protein] dehydratase